MTTIRYNSNMQANADKILVGKIVAPQGIQGEIRVQTYTQNPTDLRDMDVGKFKFVRAVPNSDVIIMRAEDVNDRNAAEALRGTELFIDRDALPAAGVGEYYIADLIGMRVGDHHVTAVHNFGAGDILELSNGEMVSFAGAKVNMGQREITPGE